MFASVNCLYCTFFAPPPPSLYSISFNKVAGTVFATPISFCDKLQNFHKEVTENKTGHHCGDLVQSVNIARDTLAYIQYDGNTVNRATLHPIKNPGFLYSGSPNTEHRHESHTARPVSSLNTHRHTQRASYKNIQVSPSVADGCYYGNTVTNREGVRVCLHQRAGTQQRSISHDSSDVYHLAQVHFFCMVVMFTANNCAW